MGIINKYNEKERAMKSAGRHRRKGIERSPGINQIITCNASEVKKRRAFIQMYGFIVGKLKISRRKALIKNAHFLS